MRRNFGPYRLFNRLGTGGMGEVWAAIHLELRMPCAIKLMKPGLQCNGSYEGMFLNEGSICAQLRHGSIVKVHDVGIIDGQLFIAMGWVDGVNLRELVQVLESENAGLLPLPLAVHIVTKVLEALDYAHNRTIGGKEGGVIHGDISLGNIMVSSHGEVLLTDFGLACFVSSTSRSKLLIGTPAYMAPEQARGQVCRQSDLYSVGAIFHELLTGHPPVAKNSTFSEIAALSDQPIPPLLREDVPEPLEALRRGLLEPHLDRRIGSTRLALAMLERWPGHRPRSSELRALYQRHVGRARSGLSALQDSQSEADSTGPSRPQASASSLEVTRPIEGASPPSAALAYGGYGLGGQHG